jgi:hypothetical protein
MQLVARAVAPIRNTQLKKALPCNYKPLGHKTNRIMPIRFHNLATTRDKEAEGKADPSKVQVSTSNDCRILRCLTANKFTCLTKKNLMRLAVAGPVHPTSSGRRVPLRKTGFHQTRPIRIRIKSQKTIKSAITFTENTLRKLIFAHREISR